MRDSTITGSLSNLEKRLDHNSFIFSRQITIINNRLTAINEIISSRFGLLKLIALAAVSKKLVSGYLDQVEIGIAESNQKKAQELAEKRDSQKNTLKIIKPASPQSLVVPG